MNRIRDIVIANCITIGLFVCIAYCLTMEVTHTMNWNGTAKTVYRLKLLV